MKKKSQKNMKDSDLEINREYNDDQFLTTNQGTKINDNQNTLKAGERGPSLLEDFIMREKITHFDHERIPERVVHARGSAAHGTFEVYKSFSKYTKANFLNDPSLKTPVFVRFSTVAGSRGSTDLARDVRGFSVKFYTNEGVFDLVGNNMPVFFIQDAMKFPDLIHAVKPEPDREIPQAASAHDTFWDFISVMPESTHMIMWLMSDRAIPRSFRMMEGFGVHTFRFINEKNESVFVKFHWKPLLGVHSVVWEEAQMISGNDPDFLRRDLWDAIESGAFPEWELGVQIVPEKDEFKYDFDLLDPTKLIPEELVPVTKIGKMTLNRNPDNFFAETEQVAFHPGHIVPGIDFTNDPLLQGRLFSYTDTQLIRLGGPNFHEIPINRSVAPVHNNQRDGYMRQTINKGTTSYDPNTLNSGCPFQAKMADGGFASYGERIDAQKIRGRSKSFFDHFSQAKLFYNSQSDAEKKHIADAFTFELGKLKHEQIRIRMVGMLTYVNDELAAKVGKGLGIVPQKPEKPLNHSIPADGNPNNFEPVISEPSVKTSKPLSMADTVNSASSRKVALLVADKVNDRSVNSIISSLKKAGAVPKIVSTHLGKVKTSGGKTLNADDSFLTTSSVLFDAVYIPDGKNQEFLNDKKVKQFVKKAYEHFKPVGSEGIGNNVLKNSCNISSDDQSPEDLLKAGISIDNAPEKFLTLVAKHRFWDRNIEM